MIKKQLVAIAALLTVSVHCEHPTSSTFTGTKEEIASQIEKAKEDEKVRLVQVKADIVAEDLATCDQPERKTEWENHQFVEKFDTYDECFQLIDEKKYSQICHATETTGSAGYYCCNPMPDIDLGWGEGQDDLEKYKRYVRDPDCINNEHDDGCKNLDMYNKNSFMDIYLAKQLRAYENGMCAVDFWQRTKAQDWNVHQLYCTNRPGIECFDTTKMHLGLPYFFEKSITNKPTQELCQGADTVIFGDEKTSTKGAGRGQGDKIDHKPQVFPVTYSHFDKQIVRSELYDPATKKSKADACKWTIQNDFKYKYLRLQDLKIKFTKLVNVKVYITSYFRDDKLSNTTYYLNADAVQKLVDEPLLATIEMYNTTHIYIVPDEKVNKPEAYTAEFEFNVEQVQEFLYGQRYNKISIYISGYGGAIMIFSVVFYLGGFTKLYNNAREQIKERQRRIKEEALLRQSEAAAEGEAAKIGANDTAKNMEELSDDDLNFGGNGALRDDAAVHEGGRQSRPGSMEQPGARKNMIKKSRVEQY